jgi:hypothetical protein
VFLTYLLLCFLCTVFLWFGSRAKRVSSSFIASRASLLTSRAIMSRAVTSRAGSISSPRPHVHSLRACLETWLWPARPSIQAMTILRPVKTGHTLLFGLLAQPSLGAPSWCLGTTWEPGWQPNCHQPLKRDGVGAKPGRPSTRFHPNITHTR